MANEHDGRIVIGRWRNNTTMPAFGTMTVYSKGELFFVDHYFKSKTEESTNPSTFALEERKHPAGRAFYKLDSNRGDRYVANANTKQLQIADDDGIILNCDPIEIFNPPAQPAASEVKRNSPSPAGEGLTIALAREFVRRDVKRAKFPFLGGLKSCKQRADGAWEVSGYVTGTNDFNAKSEFVYVAVVKLLGGDRGELLSLKLIEAD